MRILLVEPDLILSDIFKIALSRAGHEVYQSAHAQSAVHEADARAIDIVILELQIHGHSGIEFLYEFRSYPEWQDTPIIIHSWVSPHILGDHHQLLQQLGVVEHLYKPETSLEKLVQKVGQLQFIHEKSN